MESSPALELSRVLRDGPALKSLQPTQTKIEAIFHCFHGTSRLSIEGNLGHAKGEHLGKIHGRDDH